jgi:hypothetical protein
MAWCLVKHKDNFTFYVNMIHIYALFITFLRYKIWFHPFLCCLCLCIICYSSCLIQSYFLTSWFGSYRNKILLISERPSPFLCKLEGRLRLLQCHILTWQLCKVYKLHSKQQQGSVQKQVWWWNGEKKSSKSTLIELQKITVKFYTKQQMKNIKKCKQNVMEK